MEDQMEINGNSDAVPPRDWDTQTANSGSDHSQHQHIAQAPLNQVQYFHEHKFNPPQRINQPTEILFHGSQQSPYYADHSIPLFQNQEVRNNANPNPSFEFVPPANHANIDNGYHHHEHQYQHQVGTQCSSSDCKSERGRLHAKIQELSTDNQELGELRQILLEKDLALKDAQDLNTRLQADFNYESSQLRNKIWKLEGESKILKDDQNEYKCMHTNISNDLHNIQRKVIKLCRGDSSGEESFNNRSHAESIENVIQNTGVCSDTISQINFELDKALQQKETLTSSAFIHGNVVLWREKENEGYQVLENAGISIENGSMNRNEERMDFSNESPRAIFMEPLGSKNCVHDHAFSEDNGSGQSFGSNEARCEEMDIPLNGEADENGIMYSVVDENDQFANVSASQLQGGNSDDEIQIIAEIIKAPPTVPCRPEKLMQDQAISQAPTIEHELPVTSQEQLWEQGSINEGFGFQSPEPVKVHCGICDKEFNCAQELDGHMEAIHQVIVLDPCKVCGNMFKNRDQRIRHEISKHNLHQQTSTTATNVSNTATTTSASWGSSQPSSAITSATPPELGQIVTTASSESRMLVCNAGNESLTPFPYERNRIGTMDNPAQNSANSHTSIVCSRESSNTASKMMNPDQPQHGIDTAKSLLGEFWWCWCGSKYTKKHSLTKHVKLQNDPTKTNFICGSCNKTYISLRGVKNHMKMHHC